MRTLGKLFFLFTVISVIELYLLFELAQMTSWAVTIATVLVPGIAGAWLARREGAKALRSIREALLLGQEPTDAIMNGAAVLVASTLLIAPGVLTDVAGLCLLLPGVRRPVLGFARRRIREAVDRRLRSGNVVVFGGAPYVPRYDEGPHEIIDAEDIPRPGRP
jgi:UPF0716 protein FxsA